MIQDEKGNLVPLGEIDYADYQSKLAPKQQDLDLWGITNLKRTWEKYRNDFWSKYGVLVSEGIMVMMLIIISFLIMQKYVEASKILAQALREAATIAQTLPKP